MPVTDSEPKFLPFTIPTHIPPWLWLLAFVGGIVLAAASLNYAPTGRINILWLWLLWAGLPFIGSLVSLCFVFSGQGQPWLFRWRERRLHWHLSPVERLQMLLGIQQLWLVAGAGLLITYLILLLFTDLAFGWSSTLIDESKHIVSWSQTIAAPWGWLWPSAVPDASLVEATRYTRIDPHAGQTQWAGEWWRFLLASLVVYNILPRALIATAIALTLRCRSPHTLHVRAPVITDTRSPVPDSTVDAPDNWQAVPKIGWELIDKMPASEAALTLGIADWQHDKSALQELLLTSPARLRWQVNANRSPVAELGDLMQLARGAGVAQQALDVVSDSATDPLRHTASWRAFANRHQLVWLEEKP
jgi:hypothetical protein